MARGGHGGRQRRRSRREDGGGDNAVRALSCLPALLVLAVLALLSTCTYHCTWLRALRFAIAAAYGDGVAAHQRQAFLACALASGSGGVARKINGLSKKEKATGKRINIAKAS